MKRSPGEEQILTNLGPSKFSGEGFLGDDNRSLEEVIASDLRALEASGLTNKQLVEALRDVYDRAIEAYGAAIEIAPDVTAAYYESRGKIPCPFRGHGAFEKGEVVLMDLSTDQSLSITSLSIHLIERHDFFQGIGAPYRIDPKMVAEMLNLL